MPLSLATKTAYGRARCWWPPPNWSAADWGRELEQICAETALRARDLESANDFPADDGFVHNHVLGVALTAYRRQWRYGTRFTELAVSDEGCSPRGQAEILADQPSAAQLIARSELRSALQILPPFNRVLVEEFFWGERTERELATRFGMSQQAVSKHLRSSLHTLRGWLS